MFGLQEKYQCDFGKSVFPMACVYLIYICIVYFCGPAPDSPV